MLHHLLHFLWHVVATAPALVSSNWAAAVLSVGIFTIGTVFAWVLQGRPQVTETLRPLGGGCLAVFIGWIILFFMNGVKIIYDEHQALVSLEAKSNHPQISTTTTMGLMPSGQPVTFVFVFTDVGVPQARVRLDCDEPFDSIDISVLGRPFNRPMGSVKPIAGSGSISFDVSGSLWSYAHPLWLTIYVHPGATQAPEHCEAKLEKS
jgi:hypothetical protein